jgi:hypothetical protein
MGLIAIIITSFTVISLVEIRRSWPLKALGRGNKLKFFFPALLMAAAMLTALPVIAGSETGGRVSPSALPLAASDFAPAAPDSYQVGTKAQRHKGTKFLSFPSVPLCLCASVPALSTAYTTGNRAVASLASDSGASLASGPVESEAPASMPLVLDPDSASSGKGEKDARIGSILHIGDLPKSISSSLSLSVEEEYNDNIYQDANASQSPDFITHIRLDMAVRLSEPMWNIKVNYQPEQILFSHNTDENKLRHEINASLNIGADKGIPLIRNLVFLDLADTLNRDAFYSSREEKKEGFAVEQATTNDLKIHPYIRKNLTRANSLECGYEYTNTAYSDSLATDRESSGGSLILNRIFSRRLEGNISYRLTREFARSSDPPINDYIRQDVGLGLSDQLTPSVKLAGAGGYNRLAFTNGDKDGGAFWNIDLNGAFPLMKTPTFFYRYETSCQNSIDSGTLKLRRHSLGGDYQRRIHITWTVFSEKEDYPEMDWMDESSGMDASLTVPVQKRLDFSLAGEWETTDFGGWETTDSVVEEEKVKYYSIDTSIRWRIFRYFFCATGYRYYKNDSNFKMNDYRNNVTYIRVSMEL